MRSHAATPPTLDEIGISKTQSSKWQQLANVPDATFERVLGDPDKKPTTSSIITAVNGATRMDDDSLWIWGSLRDFERRKLNARDASAVFGGKTGKIVMSPGGTQQSSPFGQALEANNISRQTASRYQALAEVPDDIFEEAARSGDQA